MKTLQRILKALATLLILALGLVTGLVWSATAPAAAPAAQPAVAAPTQAKKPTNSTADHSKFAELDKAFASGPEVTKACLQCHTEAAKQIHKTLHWTWDYLNPANGERLGKKNVINNYCTAVPSNYEFCTGCHVGYDWKDGNYDFTREDKVDCLACHDTTGSYKKIPGLAGHPAYKDMEYPPKSGRQVKAVDLRKVAQSVGKSSRDTCGACHFMAGGGDAVKHGDLDTSLKNPGKYLDVHMDAKGLNFSCATCHMTQGHQVAGSRFAPTAADKGGAHIRGKEDKSNAATCQACHGQKPHEGTQEARLNSHTNKLACQTCHIPEFARAQATKMRWDWSTAGKLDAEGKPITRKDSGGRVNYDSKKGDSRWESHVQPDYVWFNGKVDYTLMGDPVNSSGVTPINRFLGSADDGQSRIWPVKRFTGKQPYDVASKSLIVFHTAGQDDTAFWKNFNWDKAIATGMMTVGAKYSGKHDFVETEMLWPITHMVAPKQDAVPCHQCHRENGRLKDVPGIYLPGTGHFALIDKLGWAAALLALLGVIAHGAGRIYMSRRK
jgi:octaheme c-type cytochrome (tetrathionate reductase family)